jgi:general secretion pathway protein A
MYQGYFGLNSAPFSIVPDHRVVYMSASHKEAVAHLLYSVRQSGGFVQLTGEVGTGKTTVCRYLLQHLPEEVDVALLVNPRISEKELLGAICDELGIRHFKGHSLRELINRLNLHLLKAHAAGRFTVLIIDEAQNLSREVLEQVRLLTNLETSTHKLLQIILIGQPELVNLLGRHDLRQLSQRIVGRFRLKPLNLKETREYIQYRLRQAGCERPLFTRPATRRIHRLSGGIPRLINVLCDASLMSAFSNDSDRVRRGTVSKVAKDVLAEQPGRSRLGGLFRFSLVPVVLILLAVLVVKPGMVERVGDEVRDSLADLGRKTASVFAGYRDKPDGEAYQDGQVREPQLGPPGVLAPRYGRQPATEVPGDDPDSRFDLVYRLGVPLEDR